MLLCYYFIAGCKVAENLKKREISSIDKSEQDPEPEAEEEVSNIEENGEILGVVKDKVIIEDDHQGIPLIKPITIDDAYEIFLNNEDYLFIDVRSEDEYRNSHIEGAIHIPVLEIEERLNEIPDDKSIIVYCNGLGCDRSGKAALILRENGFSKVYDMVGRGIFEWEEKGYPVVEE